MPPKRAPGSGGYKQQESAQGGCDPNGADQLPGTNEQAVHSDIIGHASWYRAVGSDAFAAFMRSKSSTRTDD